MSHGEEDVLSDIKKGKQMEKEYSEFVSNVEKGAQEKVDLEDFDLIKVLGIGAYGKVFLVMKKTNERYYAMKVIKKERIKTAK